MHLPIDNADGRCTHLIRVTLMLFIMVAKMKVRYFNLVYFLIVRCCEFITPILYQEKFVSVSLLLHI